MFAWGASPYPSTDPPAKAHPGPPGHLSPARTVGLEPNYAPPPPPRDARTAIAKRIDRVLYGSQRVVHKDPVLGHGGDPASIVACEHADCRAYVDA